MDGFTFVLSKDWWGLGGVELINLSYFLSYLADWIISHIGGITREEEMETSIDTHSTLVGQRVQ